MRAWRATEAGRGHPGLPEEDDDAFDSTARVLRYLAKITVEPARVHGIEQDAGSLAPGRQADGWAAELRRSEPPSPVAHPDAARLCVAGAVAAAAQLSEEVDRARLAANLRAVLGECRPPETRAIVDDTSVAAATDAVRQALVTALEGSGAP